MTKRGLLVLLVGCHSAGVAVEHRGAGGVEVDHHFEPKTGRDGHYISFPAHPFVNCVDAVVFDADGKNHRSHDSTRVAPCSDSAKYTGFVGYRTPAEEGSPRADTDPGGVDASWITEGTDELFDRALETLGHALGAKLREPRAELSFLHFSDVQIREPAAKLTSASALLDKIINTFQRDYQQELYSRYTYASIIDTVNAELTLKEKGEQQGRPVPTFMIHTGDSVDAGLKSEFDEFLAHSNQLRIPWYQVVGNHDVLAFGNLKLYSKKEVRRVTKASKLVEDETVLSDADCSVGNEECSCTQVADLLRDVEYAKHYDNLGNPIRISSAQQLASVAPALLRRICIRHRVRNDRFIMDPTDPRTGTPLKASNAFLAAHCQPSGAGCFQHLKDTTGPRYASIDPKEPKKLCATLDGKGSPSQYHGFDLDPALKNRTRFQNADSLRREREYVRAYYCFQAARLADRSVWSVVLDTNAPNGAYGDISKEQLGWLTDLLASDQIGKTDLIMLFGHHPIGHLFAVKRRDALLEAIGKDDRVVAYFTGHTHEPELRVIHAHPHHHHVWEVVAPSVISFPQQVRQVTLKTLGDEIGYFEVLTFAPQGTGSSAVKVEMAIAGAQRDTCKGSKECENGVPKAVSRVTTYPRIFFRLPKVK